MTFFSLPAQNVKGTNTFTYDPNVFTSKRHYMNEMIRKVRDTGGDMFWVLNKTHMEIYKFTVCQVTEFDVEIVLDNALENDNVFSGVFVMYKKGRDQIMKLFDEVPGTIYTKKLDCYRKLYDSLYEKAKKTKTLRLKQELVEKIEFIECEFPQFVI